MKHVMYVMFLAGLVLCAAEPQPLTKGKLYKGKTYSVRITPSGVLENGRLGKMQFMKYNVLSGSYVVPGTKNTENLNQTRAKAVKATWETLPDNSWKIVSTGVMETKGKQEAVSYRQTTLLAPGKISIDYELTGKVPMAKHWGIFHNLLALNTDSLMGCGMRFQLKGGKEKTLSLGEKPLKKQQGGILQATISYPAARLSVSLTEGATAMTNDCRSWKEQAFRFDMGEQVPWTDQPRVFQPGKVWKWSVNYDVKSLED